MPVIAEEPAAAGVTTMEASVIICTYSAARWEVLTRAVTALRSQTVAPREIIVVVDGNDALLTRASDELEVTAVVANRHPGGASGARLTGSEEATSSVLVFLDDDAIADREWLEKLLAPFTDDRVIGVGGRLVPLWETAAPAWLPEEFFWVIGCSFPGISADGVRMRNPIAANMAVRAEVYSRTGGMAAELGRSDDGKRVSGTAEETELSIRASRIYPGTYWAYAADARVRHFVPASRATFAYFVRRCRLEGAAKAILTGMTGKQSGLASERQYVRRILPRAVVANLRRGLGGEPAGLARAAAILVGLSVTTAAYAGNAGRLSLRSAPARLRSLAPTLA